jgi:hypothetical protein
MLQYTAVGIQNESHMAVSRNDYWTDLKNLAGTSGSAVRSCRRFLVKRRPSSVKSAKN